MSRHRFDMTFGATLLPDGAGVRFRFYAPAATTAKVRYVSGEHEGEMAMSSLGGGWFEALAPDARAGMHYRYLADRELVPDPAARFAPEGVYGPSEVIDATAFDWPASAPVRPWHEQVIYELHVGTFTPEGTYAGAAEKLDALVDLGITAIELMPLAQAPGARTWGYDGVLPFAPSHTYGRPDDLKRFIAAAHERGIAVLLDVVYNHFGPEGNFLYGYGRTFYTDDFHTPWGSAIALQGDERADVRRFFIENALYWLVEFRFDGLRIDAVHEIYDRPGREFMRELAVRARAEAGREVFLILENGFNEATLLEAGYDAQWDDDAHNSLHVILTAQSDGYYEDYARAPVAQFARTLTEGFAYQGEPSKHQGEKPRGEPSRSLPLSAFVTFLQNHDQIGNRPFGDRLTAQADHEAVRAAVAIVLLAPSIPMLFMGEEWAASTPFLYFADFGPELARKVTEGRRNEFKSFAGFGDADARERIPDPELPATFTSSILRWDECAREPHAEWLAFYRSLIALRRERVAPRIAHVRGIDAAFEVIGERGLRVRWNLEGELLRLDANLGPRALEGFPEVPIEPLLYATHGDRYAAGIAPPWSVRWSLG